MRRRQPGRRRWRIALWSVPVALLLLLLVRMPFAEARTRWTHRDILDAIRQVESSGRMNPPDGDGGMAIGPFQIHYMYWLDAVANEPAIGGTYEDCRRLDYAEQIVASYLRRYALAAWNHGRAETLARVHNGGPRGDESAATLRYWERVRRHLPR